MRSLIDDHKTAKGCTECGYNGPPYVLHLDHIDPLQKRNRGKAGRAVEVSWSEERIRDELDKCQVLCANCHAIKTFTSNDHLTI